MKITITEKDNYTEQQVKLITEFNKQFSGLDDRLRGVDRGDRKVVGVELKNCIDFLDKLKENGIWNRKMTIARKSLQLFKKACGKLPKE